MLDSLNQAGRRLTAPRRRVLAALKAASGPLTALEVASAAGTSVASTYRALGLLAGLGLVSELADVGMTPESAEGRAARRYALCSLAEHHHHFVCRSCHTTLEVTCDALEAALAELERTAGLSVESHEITLRGQCSRCRARGGSAC
jgi:Fur family ferric uptake transcriptional regulator